MIDVGLLTNAIEPLQGNTPGSTASGYIELIIARQGLNAAVSMADPDGNRVRLVRPGQEGVTQIGVAMRVRGLSEHRRFYRDILGFDEEASSSGLAFRLGDSLLLLKEDSRATVDPIREAPDGGT